jgi:3-hydroxyacyl-CoA dehydrogenase
MILLQNLKQQSGLAIGLGAMGFGMASHFLKSGFSVVAYDVRIRWIFLSFPTA